VLFFEQGVKMVGKCEHRVITTYFVDNIEFNKCSGCGKHLPHYVELERNYYKPKREKKTTVDLGEREIEK